MNTDSRPRITVAIPTYDRAHILDRAIRAALEQSYPDTDVLVVDDGSRDDTARVLRAYEREPRFGAIRLGRNVGTARAKNVAIALGDYDAITFHDSDDVPSPNKVLLQQRAMCLPDYRANPILDWASIDHEPGCPVPVDVVVGAYDFITRDGAVHRIDKQLSLVDDFFPNLQFPSRVAGEWILVNAGLFRRRVFSELGGYLPSVEEDRELRNRILAAGYVVYFQHESLLTKIEEADSLTVKDDTGFESEERLRDRSEVWERTRAYRGGLWGDAVKAAHRSPIDLSELEVEEVLGSLSPHPAPDVPMTAPTRARLERLFGPAALEAAE
ncbi:MAG: glycosyltransferase family 2 protein [Myxococcota bacterium]|nr:glycosyltransferase family 2 protein [Myxococcota bacterium]